MSQMPVRSNVSGEDKGDAAPNLAPPDKSLLSVASPGTAPRPTKPKSIEELVRHAFSIKGKRVKLGKREVAAICESLPKPEEFLKSVGELASKDIMLLVPRQLLLLALDVKNSVLRSALLRVVAEALETHQATRGLIQEWFKDPTVNPDVPAVFEAAIRRAVVAQTTDSSKPKKKSHSTALRANVVYTLGLWLIVARGYKINDIVRHLNDALWAPASERIVSDVDRLRELTNSHDLAALGLACDAPTREAAEQREDAARACEREAALKTKMAELTAVIDQLKLDGKQHQEKIEQLTSEIRRTNEAHAARVVHLRDDYEQLRTRMVRRLKSELDLLDEGLQALRRTPPRTNVMEDHADRAATALREELSALESEERP